MVRTTTGFIIDATRYDYDFGACNYKKGWAQLDTWQDASYFGVWINPKTLSIFTYCEGDTTLQRCEDEDEFKAEVLKAVEFHSTEDTEAKIDGMCNKAIISAFTELGLDHILH